VNKNYRWGNLAFVLASAALASALTIVLASEFGWTKFIAWMIFFVAIQYPFLTSSKYSYADCVSWLRKKKG
jgi:hypothetical protein